MDEWMVSVCDVSGCPLYFIEKVFSCICQLTCQTLKHDIRVLTILHQLKLYLSGQSSV